MENRSSEKIYPPGYYGKKMMSASDWAGVQIRKWEKEVQARMENKPVHIFIKEAPMNLSTWLDKKTAQKIDVSHIELPADISYDNDPDERLFFEEYKPCIPLPRSNDMGAGITAEVKTGKPAFIHQK